MPVIAIEAENAALTCARDPRSLVSATARFSGVSTLTCEPDPALTSEPTIYISMGMGPSRTTGHIVGAKS